MTKLQCEDLIKKYEYLHMKTYKGKEISAMFTVPINHSHLQEILYLGSNNKSVDHILNKYDDFDVVIIYDYDRYLETGIATKDSLVSVLPDILDAK
ncbi:hypothetical protein [Pedobacter agri]|uniref:hypothetical protein n=1 Tax=Pedobacter agri TaxID=454586 RepID=UPI00292E5767|nr:hypothetical protein [Pedobacter agri]